MSSFAEAGFVFFILVLFAGLYLSLFGLPGAAVVFLDVLLYALFTGFSQIGWKLLLFLLILAVLSEAVDFWAESIKIHKIPPTRIFFWGAALGGVAGMIVLTPFLWGLGIWGGFYLGGLTGLLITEWIRQSRLKIPHQAGGLAILGMIGRKTAKGMFALTMIFVSLSHIYS